MTTATPLKTTTDADGNVVETRTYIISYRITTLHNVRVERPVGMSQEDLLESIERDDIVNGDCEVSWDDVKEAWSGNQVDGIYDENFEEIY